MTTIILSNTTPEYDDLVAGRIDVKEYARRVREAAEASLPELSPAAREALAEAAARRRASTDG